LQTAIEGNGDTLMAQENGSSVLYRKTQVAREDFDARGMPPSKALRLALSKAADALWGLAVTVSTVEQVKLLQTAIESDDSISGLLMLLDGNNGSRGAAVVDMAFLSALIEVQTMGHVRKSDVQDRPLTRTDAAIVAPLMDEMLRLFDLHMGEATAEYTPAEFRFGDMIEDTRALALAMDKPEYERFRITADLGQGAKTGVLDILLPKAPPAAPEALHQPGVGGAADTLQESAMNAPVALNAVMARISMPLDQVFGLQEGQVLSISRDTISQVQLVGSENHLVASVKLGQLNGWRAVRLLGGDGSLDDIQHFTGPPAVQQSTPDISEDVDFGHGLDDPLPDAYAPMTLPDMD
jgi:flagellar motor switch protein FliM